MRSPPSAPRHAIPESRCASARARARHRRARDRRRHARGRSTRAAPSPSPLGWQPTRGIELLPNLVAAAERIARRAAIDGIRFECADMLAADLRSARLLVLASQCWDVPLVEQLRAKLLAEVRDAGEGLGWGLRGWACSDRSECAKHRSDCALAVWCFGAANATPGARPHTRI